MEKQLQSKQNRDSKPYQTISCFKKKNILVLNINLAQMICGRYDLTRIWLVPFLVEENYRMVSNPGSKVGTICPTSNHKLTRNQILKKK